MRLIPYILSHVDQWFTRNYYSAIQIYILAQKTYGL